MPNPKNNGKSSTSSKKSIVNNAVESKNRVTSDFPKHTFEQALRVPKALEEANGGRPLPPLDLAVALGVSPGSSDFRVLLSSSIKYGLTSGSFNSDRVKMEALGIRISSPVSQEDENAARLDGAFTPQTFRRIYDYYRGKKLPEQTFFENTVTREMGVPKEHSAACVSVFTANAEYLGLIKFLKNGRWLGDSDTTDRGSKPAENESSSDESTSDETVRSEDVAKRLVGVTEKIEEQATIAAQGNDKVFISHGKNREIVNQLKELLSFGRLVPVVSVEKNTTSIPVPEKVMQDMRACGAAVIHVMSEGDVLTPDGKTVPRLNENVLIEIGAAIALYGKKFVLLVQKGVSLPSNLQGLYRCEYEGDKLDYEATMKLLKTFNEIRENAF